MKAFVIATSLVLLLSACSDDKNAANPAAPAAPAATAFIQPDTTRPATLAATLTDTKDCSYDRFNDAGRSVMNVVPNKTKVYLNGWAASTTGDQAPGEIVLELVGPGHYYVKAERGIKRPDVADFFKKPVMIDAGWDITMDMSGMLPGTYLLKVLEISGAKATQCDPSGTIVISN